MITKKDVGLLANIYRGEGWTALWSVIDSLALSWQTDTQTTNTEWEYMRDSLLRDGRIEGMKLLMKEIERHVSKSL